MLRRIYRRQLTRRARPLPPDQTGRVALLFAPHPDDETLGCGGTILHKTRAGAAVHVIFMTDGGSSHAHLMPPEQLRPLRRREALAACRELGVPAQNVHFLGFPDGALASHQPQAVAQVRSLLRELAPRQVFVPYQREHPPDHRAAHRIVLAALQMEKATLSVYEYPVWFWYHWPWIGLRGRGGYREPRTLLKNTLTAWLGLRLLKDFNTAVDIGDCIEQKKLALAQHTSQMTRLLPDPRWLTLADVADGQFLACSLQNHEIFHTYRFQGTI